MGCQHSRRQFVQGIGVAGLGLVAACGRLPGQAQAPRVRRIGVLTSFPSGDPVFVRRMDRFRRALAGYGYVEGQNVSSQIAYTDGAPDGLPALAAGLVQLPVELIFADGPAAALAATQATTTLPIVFVQDND